MKPDAQWRATASLFAVTVVWGLSFVLVKGALGYASTLLFLAVRFTLAAAALVVWFRGRALAGHSLSIRAGALAGLCLYAGYLLQTAGLRFTSASKSAFITGLGLVMVPLLAALVYRKGPQVSEAIGAAVAAAGLFLLTAPASGIRLEKGDALTFGGAIAFAAHIVLIGHFAGRVRFETLSLVQLGVTAMLSWLTFSWVEKPFWNHHPALWTAVIITGILATALAFSVQAWAQQRTSPSRAAIIFAFEPVVAWLAAFAVYGETLSRRGIVGAALIVCGILTVELKPFGATRHPSN